MFSQNSHFHWTGRVDNEGGINSRRWHQVMEQTTSQTDIALLGFSCDLGVAVNKGRVGAKAGPNAIRASLCSLAWHLDKSIKDLGNLDSQHNLEEAQHNYSQQINAALNSSAFVIGLGGGHEIALASYSGLRKNVQAKTKPKIGIINFDAHFDLRIPSPNASSGTAFYQIAQACKQYTEAFHYTCLGVAKPANTQALFQCAQTLKVGYLLDEDCQLDAAKALLTPMLQEVDELYVTVCLDAFSASLAPGVSAPSSFGISLPFVISIIRWLTTQQAQMNFKWRLMDIAELNPVFDIDSRTAKLAARILFESVHAKAVSIDNSV
ncbi:formimidoylglutamase [Aliiglaciecola sp. 2_MG-2023]|uniref:formimidoylglutamase n=1 Tax=unclassified Aliiglaciecola TaxID=2593648 RepID=UPI0026E2FA87|nr:MULTISPECIES: formimidoylglutamase [unclassified Aliiglaciecola]MDO6710600.1 formimidoylglutamase [Aliiglaciecola sp. 2_MG-2023]MDO6751535.1 formimidoylglutamase [Aliiglaciecola sp. 1_MG-2023]